MTQKLALRVETLRQLTEDELPRALGGTFYSLMPHISDTASSFEAAPPIRSKGPGGTSRMTLVVSYVNHI